MMFYVVDEKRFVSNFAYGEGAEPINLGEPDYCDKCGLHIGLKKWLPPHRIILKKGVYGDFVYGSFPDFLASEKFVNSYLSSGLKGVYEFHPVEIVKARKKRKKDREPPKYFKVEIIRTNTLVDEQISGFKRDFDVGQKYCNSCRDGGIIKSYNGLYIIEKSWTGEDVFYAKGLTGVILTTQNFVNFIKENEFSNMDFIEAKKHKPSWADVYE